jgi:phosphoglucomutase
LGEPFYERIDAAATQEQKKILSTASAEQIGVDELAGEAVTAILTKTPGSGLPIGGLKVITKNGWFAARPSGTEAVYKIYAESFVSMDHLRRIQEEAQAAIAQLFKQDTPV